MMRVLFLCLISFLALATEASSYTDKIIAAEWKCSGWFCLNQEVNLVMLDSVHASRQWLASLIPQGDYYETQAIKAISTLDRENQIYCIVLADEINQRSKLFTFSLKHNRIVSKVVIPFNYGGYNISSIQLDSQEHRLLGTYGPMMLTMDTTTGEVQPLLKMWSDPSLEGLASSAFDPKSQLFYQTVWSHDKDAPCYYIYRIDLKTRQISSSPCFARPDEDGSNPMVVGFTTLDGTRLLNVLRTSDLGLSLVKMDPMTGTITETIFSFLDFAGQGWNSLGVQSANSYNPKSQWFWVEVLDQATGYPRITGVNNNHKFFSGGEIYDYPRTLRAWQAYTA